MAFEELETGISDLKKRGEYLRLKEKDSYKDLILMNVGPKYLKVKFSDGKTFPAKFDPDNERHVEIRDTEDHPDGYVQEHRLIKGYSPEDKTVYLVDGTYKLYEPLFKLILVKSLADQVKSMSVVVRLTRSGVAKATAYSWSVIRPATAEETAAASGDLGEEPTEDTPF